MSPGRSLRIAMLHPQLGLGGAERLTLDAALGLRALGHRPSIFTRELPAERSFEATRDFCLDIRVAPTRIPLSMRGRLKAPLTLARTITLARSLAGVADDFDVGILDLVAHAVPTLRASLGRPVLFYCHFPDVLLTPPRRGLYDWYRRPIDALERRGLRSADCVAVNSEFTARVFRETFPGLPAPQVLYPGVEVLPLAGPATQDPGRVLLLSVNRFTRAKNLPLAVHALAALRAHLPPDLFRRLRLVLAGGFDASDGEGPQVLESIEEAVRERSVSGQVEMIPNPSEPDRQRLLAACRCVLYTPENEHFGLGPIEAMAAGKPVVAADSGGPSETILDELTGRLRPPHPGAFAEAVAPWIRNPQEAERMGLAGRKRVEERFSRARFARGLEALLLELTA